MDELVVLDSLTKNVDHHFGTGWMEGLLEVEVGSVSFSECEYGRRWNAGLVWRWRGE